ncbi:hypothetical protein D3C72_1949510 [compost metagenome]
MQRVARDQAAAGAEANDQQAEKQGAHDDAADVGHGWLSVAGCAYRIGDPGASGLARAAHGRR